MCFFFGAAVDTTIEVMGKATLLEHLAQFSLIATRHNQPARIGDCSTQLQQTWYDLAFQELINNDMGKFSQQIFF